MYVPYGVVLLPSRQTRARFAAFAAAVAGPSPAHVLGSRAPAHVSVAHFDGSPAQAASLSARVSARTLPVKIIGLLYAITPPGDYYFPAGGVYFGLEVVRRPSLDALHREVLGWIRDAGATPLGQVGDDFRPHVTLGLAESPALPAWPDIPRGEFDATLAFGELGPYGTFPGLAGA
ncbi:2'-5' RNA ligase family protein [Actinoplanes sp. TBRC 11911]|uniref:hypothetical protein n=1 Tax=Actinoplanes sp. TBRC 11911 TaxID=2729386 RepID=UPI00145D9874|nr:hypothetical protein [Actinoplanes sp. TBRC 11911]NMO56135.1 2'-5' RNA ligase family protein [Actinoplanes sp. TBRC 11911]